MSRDEKNRSPGSGRPLAFRDGVQSLRNRRMPGFSGWLLLIVALLVTLIAIPKGGLIPDHYAPGDIASRDIKSPRDLLVEDLPLTRAKKAEAAAAVPYIYEYDSGFGPAALKRLRAGLEPVIQRRNAGAHPANQDDIQQLEADFGVPVTPEDYQHLLKLPIDRKRAERFVDELRSVFSRPLVADPAEFASMRAEGVLVIDGQSGKQLGSRLVDQAAGLNEALSAAEERLKKLFDFSAEQQQILLRLVQQQLRPTLTFDPEETELRRQAAREEVAPVLFQVKKGEMVVREGARVTADQIQTLRAIRASGHDNRNLQNAAGMFLCTLLLLYVGFGFARGNISKFNPDSRDLLFLATVFLSLFVLIKVSIFIATAMGSLLSYLEPEVFFYAIPFALGAMLVRIVLNSETALLFALCCAVLVGVLFGNSLMMALYVLTGSLVGAQGVRHCQQRTTLYRAGLWVGLANLALLLGMHFLSGRAFEILLLWKLGFGFLGGFLSAVAVNGTIPLVESVFKYTTDIKLLELANMNAPILRQLMTLAPGTYHHSILVGNLAESAAEAINANPLLVRVAAYYHDIGKIKKPLYFIENSGGQRNRHDKLAPSMSALILTSHVKDGVEVAREYKLGAELIEIIQQHHGTTLIKFFYDRARNQVRPGAPQVDERGYRYPGPKPQTREAALILLADAVEAASRTLTDPTPARIQGMVQKLINNIFIDGQLNECNLTLKDMHQIAKSFNRVLSGFFHQRVDYPEPVHIVRETGAEMPVRAVTQDKKTRAGGANSDRQLSDPAADSETASASDSPEDLRRLGIS